MLAAEEDTADLDVALAPEPAAPDADGQTALAVAPPPPTSLYEPPLDTQLVGSITRASESHALTTFSRQLGNWSLFPGQETWNYPTSNACEEVAASNAMGTFPSYWVGIACLGSGSVLSLDLTDGPPLAGTLPANAPTTLPLLTDFNLSRNAFSGPLPPSWSSQDIMRLDLSYNSLTGTFPQEWGLQGTFMALDAVALHGNRLSASLPSEWFSSNSTYIKMAIRPGNEGVCGWAPLPPTDYLGGDRPMDYVFPPRPGQMTSNNFLLRAAAWADELAEGFIQPFGWSISTVESEHYANDIRLAENRGDKGPFPTPYVRNVSDPWGLETSSNGLPTRVPWPEFMASLQNSLGACLADCSEANVVQVVTNIFDASVEANATVIDMLRYAGLSVASLSAIRWASLGDESDTDAALALAAAHALEAAALEACASSASVAGGDDPSCSAVESGISSRSAADKALAAALASLPDLADMASQDWEVALGSSEGSNGTSVADMYAPSASYVPSVLALGEPGRFLVVPCASDGKSAALDAEGSAGPSSAGDAAYLAGAGGRGDIEPSDQGYYLAGLAVAAPPGAPALPASLAWNGSWDKMGGGVLSGPNYLMPVMWYVDLGLQLDLALVLVLAGDVGMQNVLARAGSNENAMRGNLPLSSRLSWHDSEERAFLPQPPLAAYRARFFLLDAGAEFSRASVSRVRVYTRQTDAAAGKAITVANLTGMLASSGPRAAIAAFDLAVEAAGPGMRNVSALNATLGAYSLSVGGFAPAGSIAPSLAAATPAAAALAATPSRPLMPGDPGAHATPNGTLSTCVSLASGATAGGAAATLDLGYAAPLDAAAFLLRDGPSLGSGTSAGYTVAVAGGNASDASDAQVVCGSVPADSGERVGGPCMRDGPWVRFVTVLVADRNVADAPAPAPSPTGSPAPLPTAAAAASVPDVLLCDMMVWLSARPNTVATRAMLTEVQASREATLGKSGKGVSPGAQTAVEIAVPVAVVALAAAGLTTFVLARRRRRAARRALAARDDGSGPLSGGRDGARVSGSSPSPLLPWGQGRSGGSRGDPGSDGGFGTSFPPDTTDLSRFPESWNVVDSKDLELRVAIGEGSFGTVWLARYCDTAVAAKVLRGYEGLRASSGIRSTSGHGGGETPAPDSGGSHDRPGDARGLAGSHAARAAFVSSVASNVALLGGRLPDSSSPGSPEPPSPSYSWEDGPPGGRPASSDAVPSSRSGAGSGARSGSTVGSSSRSGASSGARSGSAVGTSSSTGAGAGSGKGSGVSSGSRRGSGRSSTPLSPTASDERLNNLWVALQKEVGIMSRLRHPNCCQYIGAGLDPPCIIMEYCSRRSLDVVLRSARAGNDASRQLGWPRLLAMALDAARGMEYLHTHRPPVVHRDLKSANLLVDSAWRCKVADFNLSRVLDPEAMSAASSLAATNPRWLAPELLAGGSSTLASDVWALGVVLWEIATWRMPFEGLSTYQIINSVLNDARMLEFPDEGQLPAGTMLVRSPTSSCEGDGSGRLPLRSSSSTRGPRAVSDLAAAWPGAGAGASDGAATPAAPEPVARDPPSGAQVPAPASLLLEAREASPAEVKLRGYAEYVSIARAAMRRDPAGRPSVSDIVRRLAALRDDASPPPLPARGPAAPRGKPKVRSVAAPWAAARDGGLARSNAAPAAAAVGGGNYVQRSPLDASPFAASPLLHQVTIPFAATSLATAVPAASPSPGSPPTGPHAAVAISPFAPVRVPLSAAPTTSSPLLPPLTPPNAPSATAFDPHDSSLPHRGTSLRSAGDVDRPPAKLEAHSTASL